MHKWIVGSTWAAAVLSLAVASAQTYPQPSDKQPTTKSTPSTRSGGDTSPQTTGTERRATPSNRSANTAQSVTVTGCLMQGTDTKNAGWILSNAVGQNITSSASTSQSRAISSNTGTSRSGSPSNEGATSTSGSNRNGKTGAGVSGSTSTEVGTSGARTGASVDTEAHGAGTLGATDQSGSTVGAGATEGATGNTSASQSSTATSQNSQPNYSQTPSTSTSSGNVSASGSTYHLTGVKNPKQYNNKKVEIVGTITTAANSGEQMLRVTSVHIVGQTCQ